MPNFFGRPRAGFAPPSTANLGGTDGAAAALPDGRQRSAGRSARASSTIRARASIDVVARDQQHGGRATSCSAPVANTGFNIARGAFVNTHADDAPRTIFADGGTDGTQPQPTGAFPNLLQSIVLLRQPRLRAQRRRLARAAAAPQRQRAEPASRCSTLGSGQEIADQTFNLNRGINFDLPAGLLDAQMRDNTERLFPSVPVDIDCSEATNACWVVSQGSDFIVRMTFDANGKPTINAPTAAGTVRGQPGDAHLHHRSGRTRVTPAATRAASRSARTARTATSSARRRATSSSRTWSPTASCSASARPICRRRRRPRAIRRGKIDFFTSRPFWSDRGWGGCCVVPPRRPHRHRHLVVRGRPAPDDLARRHLQQARRQRPSRPQLEPGAR